VRPDPAGRDTAGKVKLPILGMYHRHNILLGGTTGGTQRPRTVSPNSSKVRRVVIATCEQSRPRRDYAPNGVSLVWLN
jgi:hypothetical protein